MMIFRCLPLVDMIDSLIDLCWIDFVDDDGNEQKETSIHRYIHQPISLLTTNSLCSFRACDRIGKVGIIAVSWSIPSCPPSLHLSLSSPPCSNHVI